MRVPISSHAHEHLLLSVFFEVVSHCGNDVEHLFMNLGSIVYRFGEMSIQSFAQF